MDKINPSEYLQDFTLTNEDYTSVVSPWYTTEYSSSLERDHNVTAWMLAQGWQQDQTAGGTITWTRRRIDTERLLQDIIYSYVTAYNEGRYINDARYDDLVTLHAAVTDKTEDELNELEDDDATFNDLIEDILSEYRSNYDDHAADVSGDLDTWGETQRTRIDSAFDDRLAEDIEGLIDRGMYNSTLLNAVTAGNTRERAFADNDIEDKIVDKQLSLKERLYTLQATMQEKIFAARSRLVAMLHEQKSSRLALRNRVIEVLMNFAERRNDTYPPISEIGKLVADVGLGMPTGYTE